MRDRAAIEADLVVFDSAPSDVAVPAVVRLAGDVPDLLGAVSRVRELHQPIPEGEMRAGECRGCADDDDMCCGFHLWPCATRRALDGAQ